MSQNGKGNKPMNENILNPWISQDLRKGRIGRMAYLPDMEVLDSQVGRQVLSLMNACDSSAYTATDVRAALAHETRTLEDFAALLSPSAQPLLGGVAKAAQIETREYLDNSIYMFTPIYIANYCENYCTYCGLNCRNKIRHAQLEPEQIEEEMESIARTGPREILILTDENRAKFTVSYIGETCKIARRYFKVISLEIYPLNSDEHTYLHNYGVDYVTIFQETYDPDKYETLHPSGHKHCFPYCLDAQGHALKGGMRGVGLGVLLGLSDFRKDAFATGYHARLLQKRYPHGKIAFFCLRLRSIINNNEISPMDVHETQLLQMVTAYRLLIPWASIAVSTREYARVKDHLASIAAIKVSAGVSIGIGGRSKEIEEEGDSQFEISDNRSVDRVFRSLLSRNLQPVMSDYIYV